MMFDLDRMCAERRRPLLMGIVNVTGDSFSEGPASAPKTAVERALALLEDGADILDIGGESTRPGSLEIPEEEELARVLPVIQALRKQRPEAVLSIDTRKASVAEAVLKLGVSIVNDVSMLRYSPEMASVVAGSGAVLVIGHSRGTPRTMRSLEFCDYGADVVAAVAAELEQAKKQAMEAGVREDRIVVDPNFGFAKTPEQDWELLRRIDEFHRLGPVLAGISRKSFLGAFLNRPVPADRLGGTVAAALFLADCEVEIVRVHDVGQIRDAFRVHDCLRQ